MRVYVDMVGDLFHYGHVEFLRRARLLGDHLVVGVHSDETVALYKRPPVQTMEERMRVIEACRYVDEVVGDAPLTVSRDWLSALSIDFVAHGNDFDTDAARRFYAYPMEAGMYRVVAYTPGVSTSDLIERIRHRLIVGDL
ncbi:MAG: adenylyltransferase/cytidyltransferase family protein [Acidimicrobiales bacterium]